MGFPTFGIMLVRLALLCYNATLLFANRFGCKPQTGENICIWRIMSYVGSKRWRNYYNNALHVWHIMYIFYRRILEEFIRQKKWIYLIQFTDPIVLIGDNVVPPQINHWYIDTSYYLYNLDEYMAGLYSGPVWICGTCCPKCYDKAFCVDW